MTTDTIKQLGAEFHHAADGVGEALQRLERARLDRLAFLRQCSKDSTARLAARDAEAARLESQTAEDLLRQALEAGRQEQPQPEPFRAGLPPERLRKVWAEWENIVGDILMFTQDGQKFGSAQFLLADVPWAPVTELDSNARYRPHCATWARVEAMADEADKSAAPKILDLTKLPPGTVCEADADFELPETGTKVHEGERFTVIQHDPHDDTMSARIEVDEEHWWSRALVPARVVEVPR